MQRCQIGRFAHWRVQGAGEGGDCPPTPVQPLKWENRKGRGSSCALKYYFNFKFKKKGVTLGRKTQVPPVREGWTCHWLCHCVRARSWLMRFFSLIIVRKREKIPNIVSSVNLFLTIFQSWFHRPPVAEEINQENFKSQFPDNFL